MNSRFVARTGLVTCALLLLTCSLSLAQGHYSLVTGSSKLYLAWAEGEYANTDTSVVQLWDNGSGNFAAVARHNQWVYIADKNANSIYALPVYGSGSSIRVDSANIRTIDFSGTSLRLDQPSVSLRVDASGGLYVTGGKWTDDSATPSVQHSNYAYITDTSIGGDWSSPDVKIGELTDASITGLDTFVAAGGTTGAVIPVLRPTDSPTTNVIGVNGSTVSTTWGPIATSGSNPGAVAVISPSGANPLAYVLSRWSRGNTNKISTLDVMRADTGAPVGTSYDLPGNINPQSITYFTTGGAYYLGIIGAPWAGGNAHALKIALDPTTLLPIMSTFVETTTNDQSLGQQCMASADGSLFWTIEPGTKNVRVWNTSTWMSTPLPSFSGLMGESPTAIAEYTAFADPVPEPSSLLALLSLIGGAAAAFGRRKF